MSETKTAPLYDTTPIGEQFQNVAAKMPEVIRQVGEVRHVDADCEILTIKRIPNSTIVWGYDIQIDGRRLPIRRLVLTLEVGRAPVIETEFFDMKVNQ